jgi:hypothetical protein
MKKISLIAALVLAQLSFAQITKNPGDFNELKVYDRINTELIPSNENKVVISGKESEKAEVINKNGTLILRMPTIKLLKGEDITAKVYFRSLEEIEASEGSYVVCDELLKQQSMEVTSREGAEIKLKLEVDEVEVKAITGGKIKLSGIAREQEISIGTGGILEAETLETVKTKIKITTGGQADIRASDRVEAKIRAGGDITIYGNPKSVSEDIKLGGTIRKSQR